MPWVMITERTEYVAQYGETGPIKATIVHLYYSKSESIEFQIDDISNSQ